MYRIKLYDGPEDTQGTIIHSPYVNGVKVQFDMDLVLKGVSSMEFTIDPKCSMWGKIKNLTTLIRVENTKKKKVVFDGRVLMPSQQMDSNGMFTIKYICESKYAYLVDSRPRYAKLQNTSVYDSFAFFINKHNENYYYVPVTKYVNDNRDKIKIIIDELTSGPIYETNLMSFLNNNVELLNYKLNSNIMELDFNSYIFDDITNKKILEEVIYSIALSIGDNYDVNEVIFLVNNEEIEKSVIHALE